MNRNKRSNAERSSQTKGALLAAARDLFVGKGYAATGTPELVAAAKVTRGALYHHFPDKRALFAAVVETEMAAVAAFIARSGQPGLCPYAALVEGGRAFLRAMASPGRTRLLLVEAPAVLGWADTQARDRRHGGQALAEGLADAMATGVLRPQPLEPLVLLLSALYDRAALAIDEGMDAAPLAASIEAMLGGLRSG